MAKAGKAGAVILFVAAVLSVPGDGHSGEPDFGEATAPGAGTARVVGGHARGCLDGAAQLPLDGAGYQVMRPQRNRFWGHPELIAFVERFAATRQTDGWPGLLIGDLAQPRGGPMTHGHRSHQTGLDADIWFAASPPHQLSTDEREDLPAVSMVTPDGTDVAATWTDGHMTQLRTAAGFAEVDRIFVNPAIKRELCRTAGDDRAWLGKIRPWWGHDHHFHVGLHCPPDDADCLDRQPPVPPGDGCDASLDWWFSAEAQAALRSSADAPPKRLSLADLPPACRAVLFAP